MPPRMPETVPFSHPDDLTDYVVIDLETTGLNPSSDAIIQMAAVRYINHLETGSFSSYINPGCHIPARVSELTGINDDTVADAPQLLPVLLEFLQFIGDADFVTGWNVSFDLSFIAAQNGCGSLYLQNAFDTMTLYGRATGKKRCKLSEACAAVGYCSVFHNALDDCRSCGAVLKWLCGENRLQYALHTGAEKKKALSAYMTRCTSGSCPVDVSRVCRGGKLDGKSVVFTGALSFPRLDAKGLAEAAGASVKSAVSKKTDFLVVGEQDETLVGCDGRSEKEEKAEALNRAGASIAVISEVDFLKLL